MAAAPFQKLVATLRRLGPYVLIELLLPGGTLVALALWFANSRRVIARSSRDEAIPERPPVRHGIAASPGSHFAGPALRHLPLLAMTR